MYHLLNYLSLISRGSSSSGDTPPSTQGDKQSEEFQKKYDEAKKQLLEWENSISHRKHLTEEQVTQLLDAMLNENIDFVGVTGSKMIVFQEKLTEDSEGTQILIDLYSYEAMSKGDGTTTIQDIMDYYHKIPPWQRELVPRLTIGGRDKDENGGYFRKSTGEISINQKTLREKVSEPQWVEHVLYHEYAHAVDFRGVWDMSFSVSSRSNNFTSIMDNSYGTRYSESYDKYMEDWYQESFAEAVAYTRLANRYGGDNIKMYRSDDSTITYNEWAEDNKQLADFTQKFIKCNNKNEVADLFGVSLS